MLQNIDMDNESFEEQSAALHAEVQHLVGMNARVQGSIQELNGELSQKGSAPSLVSRTSSLDWHWRNFPL